MSQLPPLRATMPFYRDCSFSLHVFRKKYLSDISLLSLLCAVFIFFGALFSYRQLAISNSAFSFRGVKCPSETSSRVRNTTSANSVDPEIVGDWRIPKSWLTRDLIGAYASESEKIRYPLHAMDAAELALAVGGKFNNTMIPRIIHQTWMTTKLDPDTLSAVNSFRRLNKDAAHILWTDTAAKAFVRKYLPAWHPTFSAIKKPVYRADLFRMMVLYVFGGVYSDIDTECLRPVDQWLTNSGDLDPFFFNLTLSKRPLLPAVPRIAPIKAMIGYEADHEWIWSRDKLGAGRQYWKLYSRKVQWTHWTLAFAPGHDILANSLNIMRSDYDGQKDLRRITIWPGDLGPINYYKAIENHLKALNLTTDDFSGLSEYSGRVGAIAVLPTIAFNPSRASSKEWQYQYTFRSQNYTTNRNDSRARVMHYNKSVWNKRGFWSLFLPHG